jgi:hypothetical protein
MEKDDLEVLLRSRIPVLAVESHDETEVLKALMRASMRLPVGVTQGDGVTPLMPGRGLALFQWTVTDGLKRLDLSNTTPIRTLTEPLDILKHIRATTVAGTYALLDFHPYLDDATHLRLLKDIALEQAVVATLYTAHARGVPPDAAMLAAEIAATRPLEVVMAEKIAALREWADGRTVSAD